MVLAVSVLWIGGCTDSSAPRTPPGFVVTGTVSGLAGTGLVLQLNGAEALPIAGNGAFTFTTTLVSGETDTVRVLALPSNPAQLCVVVGGEGKATDGNVTGITVTCAGADAAVTGKILFTSLVHTMPAIFVLDLDRSTITQLTSDPDRYFSPQWSPDRSRIAFVRRSGSANDGLWVMQADGSGATKIYGSGDAGFSWSPDGEKLVILDDTLVRRVGADGGGLTTLQTRLIGPKIYFSPAWSPDGSTIAFTGDDPDSGTDGFFRNWLMNADGTNVRRLTSGNTYGDGNEYIEWSSAWSPDGTRLAVVGAYFRLEVTPRSATSIYDAVPGFQGSPEGGSDWSSDGRYLVFTDVQRQSVYIAHSDGSGGLRQLTSMPGGAFAPAWSK